MHKVRSKIMIEQFVDINSAEPGYADIKHYLTQCKIVATLFARNKKGLTNDKLQADKLIDFLKSESAIREWIELDKRERFLSGPGHESPDYLKNRTHLDADKSRFFDKHRIKTLQHLCKLQNMDVFVPLANFITSHVKEEPWGVFCPVCKAHFPDKRYPSRSPICPTCCETVNFKQASRVVLTIEPRISKAEYLELWPKIRQKLQEAFRKTAATNRIKRAIDYVEQWKQRHLNGESVDQIYKKALKSKAYLQFKKNYKQKFEGTTSLPKEECRLAFLKAIRQACYRAKRT